MWERSSDVYSWDEVKSYQTNDYSVTNMVGLKRKHVAPSSQFCSEPKTALKKKLPSFLKETHRMLSEYMTWGPNLTRMLSKTIPENVIFKLRSK